MTVRIEKSGAVWTVIHSRVEARNAMDSDSAEALYDSFLQFENDEDASVAVFWGEGGAFCAGWDLKQAASLEEPNPLSDLAIPADGGDNGDGSDIPMGAMGPSRLELNKPVIAAVSGPAVAGGMELALWCDFRVMEQSAYLGVYCRRWGIPLIDGGTVRLPRLGGEGRALELILTGRQVMAEECERLGLCEYVVPDGQCREKAEELAQQIAAFPQLCVQADRRSVRNQHGLPVRAALTQEWYNSRSVLEAEGISGANRFSSGEGRHGRFDQ